MTGAPVLLLVAMHLVEFYGPDNQIIKINPDEVVSIREPRANEQHFHSQVHCLIFTGDGKFTGVLEDCKTVEDRLEQQ